MAIEFVGIPESFRTLKGSEDGGGLKLSLSLDETQHDAWSDLSRWKGKLVKWTAEVVGEA